LKVLVKLGGTLLDAVDSRQRLAIELATLQKGGVQLVVVTAEASR
jgi:aspartokinase